MGPRDWWQLARPPTLPASVVPVLVGTAAAPRPVAWPLVLVMLAVALLLQIATNMVNEYADFHRGVDDPGSVGIAGVLVRGQLDPPTLRRVALGTYGAALILGLVLVAARGPVLLGLGVLAILAGFLYNAGPRPLSATAFGEVLVFFMMGPIEVLVSEVAAGGRVSAAGIAASLTVGALVAAILLANNLRDREKDAARGRRTLAIRLGHARGRAVLRGLVVGGAVWPALAALAGWLPATAALTLVMVPVGWWTVDRLVEAGALRRAVLLVGRLHLATGLLLAVGLVLRG
jgi:1,4-dihydroxy-2-naphthoate octaprenyltransferase